MFDPSFSIDRLCHEAVRSSYESRRPLCAAAPLAIEAEILSRENTEPPSGRTLLARWLSGLAGARSTLAVFERDAVAATSGAPSGDRRRVGAIATGVLTGATCGADAVVDALDFGASASYAGNAGAHSAWHMPGLLPGSVIHGNAWRSGSGCCSSGSRALRSLKGVEKGIYRGPAVFGGHSRRRKISGPRAGEVEA